jgi:hypothetical protein
VGGGSLSPSKIQEVSKGATCGIFLKEISPAIYLIVTYLYKPWERRAFSVDLFSGCSDSGFN